MFEFFSSLEVDGHTISPGYEYDAAKKDMVKRLGKQPEDFFLTRKMTREKFAKSRSGPRNSPCSARRFTGIPGRQTRFDLHRLGDPHPQHQRLESALLPHDRRPLRRLSGNARTRCNGTNTASSTASRATRAARIAWSTAATIPAARWARTTSPATPGRISNTTSAPSPSHTPRAARSRRSTASPRQRPSRRSQSRDQFRASVRGEVRLPAPRKRTSYGGGGCGTGDSSQRDALLAKVAESQNRRASDAVPSQTEKTLFLSPPPSTASTAGPAPVTRPGARSPAIGIPPGWRSPPRSCPIRGCSIARRTTSE